MSRTTVLRNVEINRDRFPLLIETEHDGVIARTAIHGQQFKQRQGGVRFVREGSTEELGHLARGMTEKCAAAGIEMDGMKCLVVCPYGEPDSLNQKATILIKHIRSVIEEDPGAVFGPDMGCPELVLSQVAAEQNDLLAHVTGLTREWGGLEIDNRGYTAFGLVTAIDQAVARAKLGGPLTFAIQGFGAVGAHAANLISDRGGIIRAVSNKNGVLVGTPGLNIKRLFQLWKDCGDECLKLMASEGSYSNIPENIFDIEVDVFLPAARTSVLALPEEMRTAQQENSHVQDVSRYYSKTKVKLIAEGANYPLTESAEAYLEKKGVIILPDVLVNCGGMIACRLEWEYRAQMMRDPTQLTGLDRHCREQIKRTVDYNISKVLESASGARAAVRQIITQNTKNV